MMTKTGGTGAQKQGRSLAWRIMVPMVFAALVLSFTISFLRLRQTLDSFRSDNARHGRSLSALLASQCSVAVALGDKPWIKRLVEGARSGRDAVYCTILDEKGKVLVQAVYGDGELRRGRTDMACLPIPPSEALALAKGGVRLVEVKTGAGEPILEVLRPLLFHTQPATEDGHLFALSPETPKPPTCVGFLRLAISLAEGENALWRANLNVLLGSSMGALLIILFVVITIYSAMKPLQDIAATAARVADGDLEETLIVRGQDEVGQLTRAFNHMVERLARSRGFNDLVGGTIPLGLVLLDEEGRIAECNHYFHRLLGADVPDPLGRPIREVLGAPDLDKAIAKVLSGERTAHTPLSFQSPVTSGGLDRSFSFDALVVSLPAKIAVENARCMLVLQDVTELENERMRTHSMEQQLMHSEKLASLGQLAAGVAHEFNNILQIISMHAECAQDGARPGSTLAEDIRQIVDGTGRASEIVSSLLSFARRKNLERRSESLGQIARKTMALMEPACRMANVEIAVEIDHAPTAAVDAGQIQQVLINLIQNAIHAMHPKGGTIDITVGRGRRKGDRGETAEVKVRDTGGGIAAEDLPRVFEPFFSTKGVYGQTSEAASQPGTGLGLALSYEIISDHGGELTVESEAGKGTCFSFSLPALALVSEESRTTASTEEKEEQETVRAVPCGDLPSPLEPFRVLVVDDEREIGSMICRYVVAKGLDALAVGSGEEALAALAEQGPFDVVITDMLMPGLSGLELLRRVRSDELARHVILLTGKCTEKVRRQCLDEGADACLSKPMKMKALYENIAALSESSA